MPFYNQKEDGKLIAIKDEGVTISESVESIDFTGAGVTGGAIGDDVTEDISASGTGDVTGPASATLNNIAVFDGVTGKLIKDGGDTIQDIKDLITAEDLWDRTSTTISPNTANDNLDMGSGNILTTGDVGATGSYVAKGWLTDLIVTNAISGSITGNAGTVTGLTLNSEALTLNTGALTLTPNADDSSVLTVGAGAVGVSGSNTGDQTNIQAISDTKANFDTACSDGNFTFDGDAPTAHKTSHAVGGADSVFPADPGADKYLMWDDDPGALVWADASGGVSQLSDLSDVGVTTATDKNALMADGDSWESRALVEADISDLGTYAATDQTFYIGSTQVAINRTSNTLNLAGIGTFNTHTIPGGTGTLALTTDITGTNSNTNTGDQTDMSAISDSKADFNTACTDGTFLFDGDVTVPVKATGAEVDTGTDDAKFATAKAIKDSHNVPSVAPSTDGNVMTSNGTDWVSETPAGGGAVLESRTSDYSAIEANFGKMWIISTSGDIKTIGLSFDAGTWSAGGALAATRRSLAGCGTQSAGLSFGGWVSAVSAVTEEYNGTSWSGGGNMATARRYLAGCGTQSAGLSFGGSTGSNSKKTEEYNGTSWSAGGDMSYLTIDLAGCGTQTAGLLFGGNDGSPTEVTEEYNGTSWSSGGNLGGTRTLLAGCGTQTAGLSFGGDGPVATTEEYNGSTWSSGGALSTAKEDLAGAGTQSSGLSFGGVTGTYSAVTEEYNGTAWSSGGALSTARSQIGGCGTQSAGLSFGGWNGSQLGNTEEYNQALSYAVKTFTIS